MAVLEALIISSADVTAEFNRLLKQHGAPQAAGKVSLETIEGFLKEAYRIVGATSFSSRH